MSAEAKIHVTKPYKLKTTIEYIEALKGGLERRLPWLEIRQLIDLMTDEYMIPGLYLPTSVKIYRARPLIGPEKFSNLSELVAQDHRAVKSQGRCNQSGKSVFYGALNIETAFSELGLSAGDRVQIIECAPKREKTIKANIVGEMDYVRRYGVHSPISSPEYASAIRDYWDALDELSKLRINLVDAFISDRFRQQAKYGFQYNVTSAFSDILFNLGVDAFFYPSVGHLGGWNIAMKKEISDTELTISRTSVHQIYEVLDYGIFGHSCIFDSDQFQADGTIVYPGQRPSLYFKTFDEFVYFWSMKQRPHRFVGYAVIEDKGVNPAKSAALDHLGSAPIGASPLGFQLGIDVSMRVSAGLQFGEIQKFLNEKQPNWTGVIADVVPDEGHDAAVRHLTERMNRGGGLGLFLISKGGEMSIMAAMAKRPEQE